MHRDASQQGAIDNASSTRGQGPCGGRGGGVERDGTRRSTAGRRATGVRGRDQARRAARVDAVGEASPQGELRTDLLGY